MRMKNTLSSSNISIVSILRKKRKLMLTIIWLILVLYQGYSICFNSLNFMDIWLLLVYGLAIAMIFSIILYVSRVPIIILLFYETFTRFTLLGYSQVFGNMSYTYQIIFFSMLLNIVGLLVFLLAYNSFRKIGTNRNIDLSGNYCFTTCNNDKFERKLWLILFTAFLILFMIRIVDMGGITNWLFAMYSRRGKYRIPLPYWYIGKASLSFLLLLTSLLAKDLKTYKRIIGTSLVFVVWFVDGNRGPFVTLVLIYLAYLIISSYKTNWKGVLKLVFVGLVFFIIISILGTIRGEGISVLQNNFEVGAINVDTMDCYLFILQNYGSNYEFSLGASFAAVISNWIPRIFWSNKPEGFGKILAIQKERNPFNSLGPFINGEMYANFGIPGVLIFWIIYPLFVILIENLTLKFVRIEENSSLYKGYGAFASTLPATIIRGDLLASFNNIFWPLLVLMFIYVNRVSRKKVGLPNFNGGTIEITQTKKGGPNK